MTTPLPFDHAARMERLWRSLDGLSVGDAFGQRFFSPSTQVDIVQRRLPPAPWKYTDDTEMALAIAAVLKTSGTIVQDDLAQAFATRYEVDPHRGYGYGMHSLLREILHGRSWRDVAGELFNGGGSLGNGSAMRVAPLGAYFADDFAAAARQAEHSAEVTHQHAEGRAGAVATAVAAAWAWQWNEQGCREPGTTLLDVAWHYTPPGAVRDGIAQARQIPLDEWEFTAAEALGNGERITCADTVPFCLWVAARHLDDYCEALWTTVRVRGDIDTNCAIVGGIVALSAGSDAVPPQWRQMREGLVLHA